MGATNRTKKSAINTTVSIVLALVNSLLTFVLNAVFIRLLGLEYSGINSLFSSILQLLNIADLGISNAILFRLYKKIADNDDDGICLILTTYKRICFVVAGVIAVGGFCCMPFLDHLVKEAPSFPEPLWSLFIIVLANSVITHAFNYTGQMLTAKQDNYIKTIIQYLCKFLTSGLQLLVLFLYKDIYLYLGVTLIISVVRNILYAIIVRKKYNAHWNCRQRLDKKERISLWKDTGSLAFYKICRTLDVTIDTLLITKFVAVATTAIYSSVHVIIAFLEECFGNINDGMMASIGDLYAQGEKKQVSNVFYQSMHLTFLVFGVLTVTLTPLLSPFVLWWIGYTLPNDCIYLILLNFFMGIFGNHVATFRNSMGIFKKGWKRPFFTALFNLVFSTWFIIKFGLLGTLLGTTIARVLTLHWYDPWLVCKHGFEEKPTRYYIHFILYILIIFIISLIVLFIARMLPASEGFVSLLWHGVVYVLLAFILVWGIGFAFPEQKPLLNRLSSLFKPYLNRKHGNKQ